ncbi:hypothetical protein [Mucilaginibacter humi]|nr:hypothetical protein [Mucilaginibacter humi]
MAYAQTDAKKLADDKNSNSPLKPQRLARLQNVPERQSARQARPIIILI